MTWKAIEDLLARIERQRQLVDLGLTRPARWRGAIRRELRGREWPSERAALASTFDRLMAEAAGGPALDLDGLLRIHAEAVGGGEFRRRGVRIGGPSWPQIPHARPRELPGLVERSLARAADGAEPPALAAARLHLELLLIHPFPDGNGRTARLASAYVLARAGFRSTLFTAVEQHFTTAPWAYGAVFWRLNRTGGRDQQPWLHTALTAMAGNSAMATWRRERAHVPRRYLKRWRRARPLAAAEMDRQLERLEREEAHERALGQSRHPPSPARAAPPPSPARAAPPPVRREASRAGGDGGAEPVASVIVPAWRAEDTIARCLEGLRAQDLTEPFEVIVVASGSDATAHIVRRGFPEARLLACESRLTPGAARNAGIAHARGDVVAFLAADCVPDPDWLRRRVEGHRRGHGLVGGYVDSAEPSTVAGRAHYLARFWGLLRHAGRVGVSRGPLFHLSYRREVLHRFGRFREDAVAGEDTAYNLAIVEAGERVLYDSGIRIRHLNPARWRDVRSSQREQGAAAGYLCRSDPMARYFSRSARGGRLASLALGLRALLAVARHRPRWLARSIVAFPLLVAAIDQRRRAFRRAHRGDAAPPRAVSGAAVPVAPAKPGPPRVSAVVAAYNEERLIARCLDSLLAQSAERLEVIVVDDGSSDRTAEIAERRGVRVIRVPHGGPARARNRGAAAAAGEIVVFVDADLELDRACLDRLVAPILAGEALGTFTKDMWVANPDQPWAACWTLNRGFPDGYVFPPTFPDTWSNYRAVRRDAFLGAGGYDDVGYGEDMTLAPKLGAPAVAVPGARMWHHNPSSLREAWENAVWIGRGTRVRELEHVWRRYAPWRSIRRGVRVARASGRPRFVLFKLVYDAGVLMGYGASRVRPARHWK